ncbi:hypothetical protein BX600DRAFT_496234 [Xylariales sp. PMI_506]|nr:hypothetical protein BX600DRAFT_496234 [Xylariales sp. PMI_506]
MNRDIRNFRQWVEQYQIDNYCCFGTNGYGESGLSYISRKALRGYWSRDRISRVLQSGQTPDPSSFNCQVIFDQYIVVFSILVWMLKPLDISIFTQATIDDNRLPLRNYSEPKSWQDSDYIRSLLDGFQEKQWQFCPLLFDTKTRHWDSGLDPRHILPIRRKAQLNPRASDEDDTIIYKVELHEDCRGQLPEWVIFKEYQRDSAESKEIYDNEISIYGSLDRDKRSFEHIIRCYGCFQQVGKRTIVLEYADGGDLMTLFRSPNTIKLAADLKTLWVRFFKLLVALDAIHTLTPPHDDDEQRWGLTRIYVRRIYSSSEEVQLGQPTSTSNSPTLGQPMLRSISDNQFGNGIYSAPECSYDDIAHKIPCEGDVWSLGAVASELLVWTLEGSEGRNCYEEVRGAKTVEGNRNFHTGCFHDRVLRLGIVDHIHANALDKRLPDDDISCIVSQFILDHMLVELPSEHLQGADRMTSGWRRPAMPTYDLWKNMLPQRALDTSPLESLVAEATSHTKTTELSPQAISPQAEWSGRDDNGASNSSWSRQDMSVPLGPGHSVSGEMLRPDGVTTVDNIYYNCILQKKNGSRSLMKRMSSTSSKISFVSRRSSEARADPFGNLPVPQHVKNAIQRLKGSTGRNQIFLIDDSSPMERHRPAMARTVRSIAWLTKTGGVDPDKQIELYYASVPSREFGCTSVTSTALEESISRHRFPERTECEMATCLDNLITPMLPDSRAPSPQPISLYVLTNGWWDTSSPKGVCDVDRVIEKFLENLRPFRSLPNNWLGIQFIRYCDAYYPQPLDEIGQERLRWLDDELPEKLMAAFPGRSDIVDTRRWDEDVENLLLGPVFPGVDKRPSNATS